MSGTASAARTILRSPHALAWGVIAVLLLLNPLTYAIQAAAVGLFPDSMTYLAFSERLLRGEWTLTGWGHVDSGLILPPAYPALVGLWGALTGDRIAAAYVISTAALLLAIVPLALLALRRCGPAPGFFAVALTQYHPFFLEYGAAPLTEALFVLGLATATFAAVRLPVASAYWPAALLGVAAGLLFLVRSVGGFFWPALIAVLVLRSLGHPLKTIVGRTVLATGGFAAILAPYAIAVHAESGHWPSTQSFRLNQYAVTADAPAPAAAAAQGADYEAIYAERRQLRRLNEAGTEMLASQIAPAGAVQAPDRLARLRDAPRNLERNLDHMQQTLGWPALILLLLSLTTPFWRLGETGGERWVLPVILVSYLCALSLVSGAVARYVDVLVPFAWIQIFAEAARLTAPLRRSLRQSLFATAAGSVALAALCALTLPRTFAAVPLSPRIGERGNPLATCGAQIPRGAPVFSFHPLPAWLLGGTYRVVPNDTLARVAAYGAATGTHFLLLTRLRSDRAERALYDHAPWARDDAALISSDHAEALCATDDGIATLYRLRP